MYVYFYINLLNINCWEWILSRSPRDVPVSKYHRGRISLSWHLRRIPRQKYCNYCGHSRTLWFYHYFRHYKTFILYQYLSIYTTFPFLSHDTVKYYPQSIRLVPDTVISTLNYTLILNWPRSLPPFVTWLSLVFSFGDTVLTSLYHTSSLTYS